MRKIEILLSSGSILSHGLINKINYIKDLNYDGLEILPSRSITKDIKRIIKKYNKNLPSNFDAIKSIHQSWRLDIGHDKSYGIKFPISQVFTMIRFLFFPKINDSNNVLDFLSQKLNLPIIVHDLSNNWTDNNNGKKFYGGILYEIIGNSTTPNQLKTWLKKKKHNVVIDLRDDQSLIWAKKNGFTTWQKFWQWIGLDKIKNIQLTFIGMRGLKKILNHQKSLSEEQLLWLNKNKWNGQVTVEINPLVLFFLCKTDMKKGFEIIAQFVRQTLIHGKKWS